MRNLSGNLGLLGRAAALGAIAWSLTLPAWGVVTESRNPISFTTNPLKLRSSLILPIADSVQTVTIPDSVIRLRATKADRDPRIEPMAIQVPVSPRDLDAFALQMARPGSATRLADYLRAQVSKAPANDNGNGDAPIAGHRYVRLDSKGLSLVDAGRLAALFNKTHHQLTVSTKRVTPETRGGRAFLSQLRPFLTDAEMVRLKEKLWMGTSLSVDKDLLPAFAKRMVKRFIAYRGPNCFHAALAFQDPKLTSSALINVKEEEGYHRAMINYDELWRVLKLEFYEVDPSKSPLKYGDVVVFFDLPKSGDTSLVNYKWIRHTAAYLFNGYTFSKGSKSPNTPYTVKTLDEEWATWKRYTNNMGVKIFRRSDASQMKRPPKDLNEWLY